MSMQPSFNASAGTFTPDDLIAGDYPMETRPGTILTGQVITRGTLLGKITVGAASVNTIATKGALTLDAVTPILTGAQVGAYKVRCIQAIVDSGEFEITDPNGNSLGTVLVGGTFANQIKFAIADAAVDFVAGDTFTVTVAAGSGKMVKSLKAAVDGSQVPDSILLEDVDATAADKVAPIAISGSFNENSIVYGTGHTAASVRDVLRDKNIYTRAMLAR